MDSSKASQEEIVLHLKRLNDLFSNPSVTLGTDTARANSIAMYRKWFRYRGIPISEDHGEWKLVEEVKQDGNRLPADQANSG